MAWLPLPLTPSRGRVPSPMHLLDVHNQGWLHAQDPGGALPRAGAPSDPSSLSPRCLDQPGVSQAPISAE